MPVPAEKVQRIAGLELNALRMAEVLSKDFETVKVPRTGTPVYDINGTLLFYRMPLARARTPLGYADIAVNEAMGEPLLAVTMGAAWEESAILEEAKAAARKAQRSLKYDSVRFVAYSFPKIALQFLLDGREVLMLEWRTWAEVPPLPAEGKAMKRYGFERWSLIDEMAPEVKRARVSSFKKRQALWEAPALSRIEPTVIKTGALKISKIVLKLAESLEIHYSPRSEDHFPCYELRGQQTGVWCVAASVEMLMNFYRYQYNQPRLAQEMDLGTCDHPNGLPYGDEDKVVDTIENLSSKTLDATAIADPTWSTYPTEIKANRPLISFIPGHSRTVAGYTWTIIHLPGVLPFKGLLVYDPWPPTDCAHPEAGGVITKWENFNTQTYRYAFTAVLKEV